MRSKMIWPVSLSSSYFFFEPFSISITAMKSSGLMRDGLISCQMFVIFVSFLLCGPGPPAPHTSAPRNTARAPFHASIIPSAARGCKQKNGAPVQSISRHGNKILYDTHKSSHWISSGCSRTGCVTAVFPQTCRPPAPSQP